MSEKRRRTRAIVDVDEVIIRADNVIIIGDRDRRRSDVLGVADEPRRRHYGDRDGNIAGDFDSNRRYHY